jgi:hypothetical protein
VGAGEEAKVEVKIEVEEKLNKGVNRDRCRRKKEGESLVKVE